MSFRVRMSIAFMLTGLVPVVALSLFVRHEMSARVVSEYENRVDALVDVIEGDLDALDNRTRDALATVREAAAADNRFRLAAVDRPEEDRRYLIEYAGEAMKLAGLSMLQIQDHTGRILSSGHFRNEFDRVERELPKRIVSTERHSALVDVRAPEGPFLALARVDSLPVGEETLFFIGGVRVDGSFLDRLTRDVDMTAILTRAGDDAPGGEVVRRLSLPFVGEDRDVVSQMTLSVIHDTQDLRNLRAGIDRWILIAVIATSIFALLLAWWFAARISRPLSDLAARTARVDLDRLDVDFTSNRRDEIGALSRLLGTMTERLRAGALRIRDAERRATRGEIARQVNHDIKNGLTPIRNIFKHLRDEARATPSKLPDVFAEREGSLESSISYLESLASNYAKLSAQTRRERCDLGAIVTQVADDLRRTDGPRIDVHSGAGAVVMGDPLSLRRVVENLSANAIDAAANGVGVVTLETAAGDMVRLTVSDNGPGIAAADQDRIFDDFFTTKSDGTGLGLSIVRRLVMDMSGTIRVESEAGNGARFIVEFPKG